MKNFYCQSQFARSLATLGALLLISACGNHAEAPLTASNTQQPSNSKEQTVSDADIWPVLDIAVKQDPTVEARVAGILAKMTLEQKVAQMIQPEIRDVTVEDMRRYGFGSYLNGGGAFPQNNKHATPTDWITLAEDMYQASIDDSLDGSTIPTMWGTDAVHGHNNVIGATLFPHNIGLGAANNPELIEEIARATAREVMVTGIDWVFAPTVAVVRDDRWGRTYEGYSEDPEIVRSYAGAIVKGLQGAADEDFLGDKQVIATVKHFLGDGGTEFGIDQGNNLADEQALFDIHAQGYVGGLSAGAQTVMASFNSWQGNKLHGQKYLLNHVLKERMGFDGLVVGDWLGHGQVSGCSNYSCSKAINAGLDIFMASGDSWKPLLEATIEQARSGEISLNRIDDAVTRILRVKVRAGLFEKPSPAKRPMSGKLDIIGSPQHREIARRAVRESLVLLKNANNLLPLNPNQKFLLAGDAAHNIGKQSGGWTVTWQGTGNTNADFPGGTSIYSGFKAAIDEAGGSVELAVDGNYQNKPDVAIVVFGENPYAEGVGDVKTIEYQPSQQTDLALLQKLKSQEIPVVSVLISGRPLWVNRELNASNAFVAAWLPGSEGAGVSDVLLRNAEGQIAYDFTGKLAYSWPAKNTQTSVNRFDADYAPLLAYGYGQQYGDDDVLVGKLSEKREGGRIDSQSDLIIFDKALSSPFKPMLVSGSTEIEMTSNVATLGGLKVRTLDKDIQEDARLLMFSGTDNARFQIKANQAVDLTALNTSSASLQATIKVQKVPTLPVLLSMECDTVCSDGFDIKPILETLAVNTWQDISIDFKCFQSTAAALTTISSPFSLFTEGEFELAFSDISLVSKPGTIQCQ